MCKSESWLSIYKDCLYLNHTYWPRGFSKEIVEYCMEPSCHQSKNCDQFEWKIDYTQW